MLKKTFFLCLVLWVIPGWSLARTLEDLYQDFSPIEALVINVEAEEVILDKGRADGLHPGDIFTVYKLGKELVHPVTKKVIGHLKVPVGKVEVRRLDQNFSTAIILSGEEIKVGAPAVRFQDLRVLFLEVAPGVGDQILPLLKTKLSGLTFVQRPGVTFESLSPEWLSREGFDLVFVADQRVLRVYNARLEVLQIYGLAGVVSAKVPQAPVPSAQATGPQVPPAQAPPSQVPPPQAPPPPQVAQAPPAGVSPGPYPYSTLRYQRPAAPSFRRVGRLNEVVIDFDIGDVDRDGRPEIVYLTPTTLFITKYRSAGAWKYEYKGFGRILNFSLGPRGWIALNVYVDKEGMRSQLLRFYQGRFEVKVKDINLILGFFDFDGDGVRETLLGQTYDLEDFFGMPVFELRPKRGGGLEYHRRVKVPLNFKILGAAFADLDGDGEREIISMDNAHKLCVFRGTKSLWKSNRKVGGSVYAILVSTGRSSRSYKRAIAAEVEPVVRDINGDGREEVLVVVNKSAHRDLLPGIPAYESGEVMVLTLTSTGLDLLPLTGKFEGPLQGLAISGQEVFVVFVKGNPFTQEGESYLLAFPLVMPSISSGPYIPYSVPAPR